MKIVLALLVIVSLATAIESAEAQIINGPAGAVRRRPGVKPAVAPSSKDRSEEADGETTEEPAEPVDPELIKLYLMDGSVISGKLSVKQIDVETQYGQLTVPITELRSFTPGLISHPDLNKQIFDLIDALGSDQFEQREKSQKALVKLGRPVRGELEKRSKDADNERRTRIKAILDEFDEQADSEDEESRASTPAILLQRDQIETNEFTAVGRITTPTLTVASLYGPLTVKLADVRRGQRDAVRKSDIRKTVTVDSSFFVQQSMKDTKIRLERGDLVSITADGTLTLPPWGNGASCGPDGAGNYGWYIQGTIPIGALVGVVGNGDGVFKVGSKNTFRAERSGNLRLAIGMQGNHIGQEFPGRYTVRIRVERGASGKRAANMAADSGPDEEDPFR